ncbi:hypothetical protein AVEN_91974-1 [Araneus ventricosus]|uniref:Uncharacterized protein n=1 Tax=Araneus ventricosus TaxID=182803 RepID=A0A4Y2P487_ARAVE|nr:hypothetical protein AVEN_3286-1 [Araneus ventricosus]GBN45102.1 hypothetical protein AVEN_67073-1 [Araneus ventricosus]GBN45109.1 hypothetical protein AVEN_79386-1 [Araneus ventricosus]GBN45117.1 hypothetical protein AVEN_91974-1 [Araneus ventricosus]
MASSSCMAIPVLLTKLKNSVKSSSWMSGAIPLASNLGSKHLSGTRFSSNSDVKTAAENCLNGQRRDFYQARLNKLGLRLDKFLNRFGDYVEK